MKFLKENKFLVITLLGTVVLFGGLLMYITNSNNNVAEGNKDLVKEYTGKSLSDLSQSTIDIMEDDNYRFVKSPESIAKAVKKDDVFVYIFSPECSHCQAFTPILNETLKAEKIPDEKVMFLNVLEYPEGFDTYQANATPTFIHYKDGKEVDRFVGEIPTEELEEFLK